MRIQVRLLLDTNRFSHENECREYHTCSETPLFVLYITSKVLQLLFLTFSVLVANTKKLPGTLAIFARRGLLKRKVTTYD